MEIQIRTRTLVLKKTSKGVLYPNIFLGLLFIILIIAERCASEIREKISPFFFICSSINIESISFTIPLSFFVFCIIYEFITIIMV